jgi:hypothetical protein
MSINTDDYITDTMDRQLYDNSKPKKAGLYDPRSKTTISFISCDDCDEEILENDLENHMENICQFRLIYCPIGEECDCPIIAKDLEKHLDEFCIFREVKCDYCEFKSVYNRLYIHSGECNDYPLVCTLCKTGFIRKDWRSHTEKICIHNLIHNKSVSSIDPNFYFTPLHATLPSFIELLQLNRDHLQEKWLAIRKTIYYENSYRNLSKKEQDKNNRALVMNASDKPFGFFP